MLAQVVEAELAAALGTRDALNAVAITSAGGPLSWRARAESLWRGRLAELRDEAVRQAESGAFRRELAQLLEAGEIRTVFQPIVHVYRGDVIGYEALSRGPVGHPWERPEVLLDIAERSGMSSLVQWEMVKRARARAVDELDYPRHLLFLNAPDSRFWPEGRHNTGDDGGQLWPWDHIVSEVSERRPILNRKEVWAAHDRGRQRGARYALDDVGAGYAGLAALAMLGPDYVKIDMGIVRDCHEDPAKQAVIEAIVQYSKRSGALAIAEGIETPDEEAALRELSVSLMQGFLMGKPMEHI
ncbi:MAG: EAL domain-containing protein [Candidatus Dormibacteraeota bacterium]|nr:EAL domain-containing protein [Candidatus Dormibacteraeota bacterium]